MATSIQQNIHTFLDDIRRIIDAARTNAVRSVDFCRVQMYWQMGQRILEEEQQGKDRADYGFQLPYQKLSKAVATGIWKRLFCTPARTLQTILQTLSNCVRTAVAIELDTI